MVDVMCMGFVLITGLAQVQVAPPAETLQPSPVVAAPATPGQTPPATTAPSMPGMPGMPTSSRVLEPVAPAKSRYLVQVMEGVLQNAVRYAAGQMAMKLRAVSPDLLQLSGAARARGFRLDGYGVFFDVEVPAALRQTMGWTARMMQQNDQHLDQALQQLRRAMNELDGRRRLDAETALKLLELRARPFMPRESPYSPLLMPNGTSAAVQASSTGTSALNASLAAPDASTAAPTGASPNAAPPTGAARGDDLAWMQNPDGAYEMEVREALIGAMLGYGNTLVLQPDEWLTVAARDNQTVVVPGDLTETVTVILRIKGSDLAELMAGRLTEQDARRRVEVREF